MIKVAVMDLIDTYGTNNPFELCKELNIKIMRTDLGNEIKGFFQKINDQYRVIHINSNLTNDEERYICAHELGHAIIHPEISISFFIDNPLQIKNKYELQADKFAAELILPSNLSDFDCGYDFNDLNAEQICICLGIPMQLLKYKFDLDI
ncbi:ImmA/IrrE family metallo-endopeptidase [Clostridium sp.]|uniref:ImmA/IrrE family metallo-endopeptidase n=1 Tax=Clostridium sp. TaxID=1506 RepID=UPI0032167B6D